MSIIARTLTRCLSQGSLRTLHTTAAVQKTSGSGKEGRIRCTLIPGDGVGPELTVSLQEVFRAANCPVDFDTFFFSEVNAAMSASLEDVSESIRKNKVCIKGILETPISHTGELEYLNLKLRKELDLFANIVHVRSMPGVQTRHKNIDCVIIREQTEGEFSALEHESIPGVVECLKIITSKKSERIAKFAFDYAVANNRKKVTCVHKANIMKLGDGLFLKSCKEISQLYPRIKFESMIVDNTTMQLVSNPNQFDVMVAPNLYGSICDNISCGLVGGAGLVPAASYSSEACVFEPGARHTFSEAVGKNVANPIAFLLCGTKMLRHVNLKSYAERINKAIEQVLSDGKVRTKDIGGQSSTNEFTNAIIAKLG